MILNPPSPPYFDVCRDWAGGFGTATRVRRRTEYGHSGEPNLHPFLPYASGALLKADYEHMVLDCQRLKLSRSDALDAVSRQGPAVIFSLIGLPSLKRDCELLDLIKGSNPNATIVGVGTCCRFLQNEILTSSKIDAVLRSRYPYVSNLVPFLNVLERKQKLTSVPEISWLEGGKVLATAEVSETDLDNLERPEYSELELDGYQTFHDLDGSRHSCIPILGSRGCPYPCVYCPCPLGFGERYGHRSPKDIVTEIQDLLARGVDGILFRDQSFAMNRKHAAEVCQEIINRRLDIAWICEARVDHVSKGLLETMKRGGCKEIHFGVETGDPELIRLAKPGVSLHDIRRAFRLTKQCGLSATAHVVLGWPDETVQTLQRTYAFIRELAPDRVNWNVLTPYPGTALYDMARRAGLIWTNDWSRYTSHTVVMRTRFLSVAQLEEAIERISRDYWKWRVGQLLLHAPRKPRFVLSEVKKIIQTSGFLS